MQKCNHFSDDYRYRWCVDLCKQTSADNAVPNNLVLEQSVESQKCNRTIEKDFKTILETKKLTTLKQSSTRTQ